MKDWLTAYVGDNRARRCDVCSVTWHNITNCQSAVVGLHKNTTKRRAKTIHTAVQHSDSEITVRYSLFVGGVAQWY